MITNPSLRLHFLSKIIQNLSVRPFNREKTRVTDEQIHYLTSSFPKLKYLLFQSLFYLVHLDWFQDAGNPNSNEEIHKRKDTPYKQKQLDFSGRHSSMESAKVKKVNEVVEIILYKFGK